MDTNGRRRKLFIRVLRNSEYHIYIDFIKATCNDRYIKNKWVM